MSAKFNIREVSPCLFAVFIDLVGFGIVYPVLTALFMGKHSLLPADVSEHVRFFYLSLGFLVYPLFMFFGSALVGDFSDIWGRKKMLMACMAGFFIGFAFVGYGIQIGSLTLFFIGRAISGLMGASIPVALAAIADLSTHENKPLHMSFVALVESLGFVLGPFLGGVLSKFGFAFPFYLSSVLSAFAFFWIWLSFQETFVKKDGKTLSFMRFFKVFAQAFQDRAIRLLALVFFLMQIGISLYLQLIIVYLSEKLHYSAFKLGLFNAYLGFWFAIGLLLIIPYASKRYPIEKIAVVTLLINGLAQTIFTIVPGELALWIFAIPFAIAMQVTFTALLASISNAAGVDDQGWAMGISGSIIALSFVITGISPNLVPIFGAKILILVGGIVLLLSSLLQYFYCKKHIS